MSGEIRRPWTIEVVYFLCRRMKLFASLLPNLAPNIGRISAYLCRKSINFLVEVANNADKGLFYFT